MAQFRISGEFLTERARQMVLEDDWTFGAKFLVDSLDGITEEQALNIVKGTHRLVGTDDILYREEDEAGRAAVRHLYGATFDCRGTLLYNSRRYQPYAYVDSFGIQDALVPGLPVASDGVAREWSPRDQHFPDAVWKAEELTRDSAARRAMHYATNPQRDLALRVTRHDGSTAYALFEPEYDNYPSWLPCFRTAQDAFSAAEATLHPYGHRQKYPPQAAIVGLDIESDTIESDTDTVVEELSAVDAAEWTLRLQVEEEAARKKQAVLDAEVATLRQRIIAYANADAEYGWKEFVYTDEESGRTCKLRAPQRAMIAYALSKTNAVHLRPAYTAFSPQHLKLLDDNPLHTDAWLGCGFDLGAQVYDHKSLRVRAFAELAYDIQKNLLGYKAHVLAGAGIALFEGRVVTPQSRDISERDILVVLRAGVEYDVLAGKAGAVICETGGPLAHLVTVSRERGIPVLRVDDATRLYREGLQLRLDIDKGEVRVIADLTGGMDYGLLA